MRECCYNFLKHNLKGVLKYRGQTFEPSLSQTVRDRVLSDSHITDCYTQRVFDPPIIDRYKHRVFQFLLSQTVTTEGFLDTSSFPIPSLTIANLWFF